MATPARNIINLVSLGNEAIESLLPDNPKAAQVIADYLHHEITRILYQTENNRFDEVPPANPDHIRDLLAEI